jgi:hypothetical protein
VSVALQSHAQTSPQPDTIILEQSLSTNTCYIGEALPITLSWYVQPPIGKFKAVDIRLPVMETNLFKIYESHKEIDKPNSRSLGIPLTGTRAIANVRDIKYRNHNYTLLKIKKVIVPDFTGSQEIAPATITCAITAKDIPVVSRRRKPKSAGNLYQYPLYFDNNFFDLEIDKSDIQLKASSSKIAINVLPLPPSPSPLFNGLVGKYNFSTGISTNTIRQGDSLTLKLTVSGNGYLEHIKLPPLELHSGFTNNFRVASDRRLTSINGKQIVYSQKIYPRHTGKQTIPSLALHYFDPISKQYKESKSAEIEFTVKKTHIIDGSIFGLNSGIAKEEPNNHLILRITLAMILLFGGVFTMRKLSKNRPIEVIVSPDKAYRQFQHNIEDIKTTKSANTRNQYNALNAAITEYLSTQLSGYQPGAITPTDIHKLLIRKNADVTLLNAATNLFKEIDKQRFSPAIPTIFPSKILPVATDFISKIENIHNPPQHKDAVALS